MIFRLFLAFLFIGSQFMAYSQKALDFSMIDIDGKEWNLFSELDKGKTVVLDFFFADCIPCQTLTPQVVALYNDYGNDTGNILVLGISDRDNDLKLKTFETDFGVNYPSCGIAGGGDTITALYSSWFTFFGWPTYAVVCPNRNISWDVDKSTNLPEIIGAIDNCILYSSVPLLGANDFRVFYSSNRIYIKASQADQIDIELYNLSGQQYSNLSINRFANEIEVSVDHLNSGLYFVLIKTSTHQQTFKFIKP